ncbi:NUDIX domain-containing protein [Leptospira ilyithenensis]|uniref:NUDIX domain-containing protein n=1 Tax=Leptospira ilyithenensis TaxID=2484901 RepID=UPI001AF024A1|nr:NUDIX hydrolase [Leptospira ilyithenensis]
MDFLFKKKGLRVRVAALIQDKKGKVLLIQQTKKGQGYWLLPGGGIEFGESAEEALQRELKEELELDVISSAFLLLNESIDPKKQRHLIQLVFQVKVKDQVPKINPQEKAISGFGYFTFEELQRLDLRPDIKEYFKGKKRSLSTYVPSKWVAES